MSNSLFGWEKKVKKFPCYFTYVRLRHKQPLWDKRLNEKWERASVLTKLPENPIETWELFFCQKAVCQATEQHNLIIKEKRSWKLDRCERWEMWNQYVLHLREYQFSCVIPYFALCQLIPCQKTNILRKNSKKKIPGKVLLTGQTIILLKVERVLMLFVHLVTLSRSLYPFPPIFHLSNLLLVMTWQTSLSVKKQVVKYMNECTSWKIGKLIKINPHFVPVTEL